MARGRRSAAPRARAPMQQSSGGGMLSGIGSTIAQGMAFGTGSAIAHRAVGAVANSFGGGGDAQPAEQPLEQQQFDTMQQQQMEVCVDEKKMFYDCLNVNKGDQQACTFLMDMIKDCQRNQAQNFS